MNEIKQSDITSHSVSTYLKSVLSLFFFLHFHSWPHLFLESWHQFVHTFIIASWTHIPPFLSLLHPPTSLCKSLFLLLVFFLLLTDSQMGRCMLHHPVPLCTVTFFSVKLYCSALTRNRCSRPIYNKLWVSSLHLQEQAGTLGSLGFSAISHRLLLLLSLYFTLWTLNCGSTLRIGFLAVFWADAE